MKVLVTGASGFLGGHLVDHCLAAGDDVRALVRPTSDTARLRELSQAVGGAVELVDGDLTAPKSLAAATRGVDVVYHAAARVTDFGTRRQFWDTNVAATRALVDAARRNGVSRFVFVSSPSVVTDDRDQVAIDESYPYPQRFVNLYSETKALAEQLVLGANGRGFVTCAIRPRGIWGPRDRTGFLPKIVAKLAAGRLPDLSSGKHVQASLCYVDHAAAACLQAARAPAVGGKAYFVCDAEPTDVWPFANVLADLFELPRVRRRIPLPLARALARAIDLLWQLPGLGDRRSPPLSRYALGLLTLTATYDTTAARRDFGYCPTIDQPTGLRRLRAWVDEIGGIPEFTRFVT